MNYPGNTKDVRTFRENVKHTAGYQRIASLFDPDTFREVDSLAVSGDGPAEAVAGFGMIEGRPVCAFSQNGAVSGGAMSKAQASKIKKAYQLALKTGCPLVGIYDSSGCRLKEGADMLAAYGEILLASNNLSGVVPQISLVLGPCTGTSALIAAGADIVVMSAKGELTVSTSGEDGSPEAAEGIGVCHLSTENEAGAISAARKLIDLLPSNNLSGSPIADAGEPAGRLQPGASVREIAVSSCDKGEFLELAKRFGSGSVTGLGRIEGGTVGLVGLSGTIGGADCSKAARFVRFCDSFSIPVVTFVDAERFSTLREASKLSSAYSEATAPKVTVVTGSACGPVYLATVGRGANADYSFAWPDASVSALSPETAAVFLWNDRLKDSADPINDRKKLIEEYRKTEAGACAAAAGGMIDDVVEPDRTRDRIAACLELLSSKRVSTLPKKHADIQL